MRAPGCSGSDTSRDPVRSGVLTITSYFCVSLDFFRVELAMDKSAECAQVQEQHETATSSARTSTCYHAAPQPDRPCPKMTRRVRPALHRVPKPELKQDQGGGANLMALITLVLNYGSPT